MCKESKFVSYNDFKNVSRHILDKAKDLYDNVNLSRPPKDKEIADK